MGDIKKRSLRWLVAVVAAAILFAVVSGTSSQAAVGINSQINFEGKVVNTNGTNLPDGTYNMEFKVYQDGTSTGVGSTLKWTETRLVSGGNGVTVTAGTFQVNLGSVTAFASNIDWNQDTLWLSMNVGGTAGSPVWDGEMSPYIRLTSVPYALNAGMVGGLTASQLVQLSPGSQQSGAINVSGNIKSGATLQASTIDAAASGTLTVGSTNTTALTLAANGATRATFDSAGKLTLMGALNAGSVLASSASVQFDNAATSVQNVIAINVAGTNKATYRADSLGNLAFNSTGGGVTYLNVDSGTGGVQVGAAGNANNITVYGGYTQNGTVVNTFTGASTFTAGVLIGSATSDGTLVTLQLDSLNTYADGGMTCTTSTNQGAMYYNTVSATMRACVNGVWEDLISTGGMGLLAFGVVPDSPNAANIGELTGITQSASPCKVYWASASSVTVAPCYAYSGGRRVAVASTTLSTSGIAANSFTNVCLNGANGAPALSTTPSTTETSATLPAWNANNPVLCLATLQISITGGNITAGKIFDTRTFTTTQKTFATTNTAVSPGFVVVQAGATLIGTTAAAGTGNIRGVVVAYSGAVSTTTANAIIATAGPQWVKATGTSTAAQDVETAATAGYTTSIANATTAIAYYNLAGVATRTIDTTCTSATTCQYSQFLNPMSIR